MRREAGSTLSPAGAAISRLPVLVTDGLAVYAAGEGEPLLLMPYPHGFGLPFDEWPLVRLFLQEGRRVVSFDPPGAFCSDRRMRVGMPEMLSCAEEALGALGICSGLDVVGHSMGGLCSIAWAIFRPDRVQRLVLVGALSGGPAISRYRGMPWGDWLSRADRMRFTYLGMRLSLGLGNLAVHKQLQNILLRASYFDKRLVPEIAIAPGDARRRAPVRDAWPRAALTLDYSRKLRQIRTPALVCVGRHDPQTPVGCSEELASSIPGARLEIFERSGHYPFMEERDRFERVVGDFLVPGR